jgi:hypothetical protein
VKADAERMGRDPAHMTITPSAYVVAAETRAKGALS